MYDGELLRDKLEQIAVALTRIERRFAGIHTPDDFIASELNRDKLDAIAMLLIAIGESFKKIDKETTGTLLIQYPTVDWKGVIGTRNILAHAYF